MSQLLTGTVTLLLTDIEGSTLRWDAHPDAIRAALERHDALMREAIEARQPIWAEDRSRFGASFAPVRIRKGLCTGGATERGEQVLASATVVPLLRGHDLGAHGLLSP